MGCLLVSLAFFLLFVLVVFLECLFFYLWSLLGGGRGRGRGRGEGKEHKEVWRTLADVVIFAKRY